jgi:hypothetical protein
VVCEAECLPRKELFESWEFARRVRRRFRGGRVVDLASGHGLVALLLVLLDDRSPTALAVDPRLADSATLLRAAFEKQWPRLEGRLLLERQPLSQIPLMPDDLVVSAHACGVLTDRVLERAVEVRARVAVLPCCHAESKCDAGGLDGWMDNALAIDATRAARLRAAGYRIYTHRIPESITPKNRILMGEPSERAAAVAVEQK